MFGKRKETTVTQLPDPHEVARENYARIRNRIAEIDREIRDIDNAAWSAMQTDTLDAAAVAYKDGTDLPALSPSAAERRAGLIREREIASRALALAKDEFHKLERRRQRAAASELRPQHKRAVADIYAALRLLSDALDRERACHDQVGGLAQGTLPRCGLPIGSLSQHDSVASVWARTVAKAGYADIIANGGAK